MLKFLPRAFHWRCVICVFFRFDHWRPVSSQWEQDRPGQHPETVWPRWRSSELHSHTRSVTYKPVQSTCVGGGFIILPDSPSQPFSQDFKSCLFFKNPGAQWRNLLAIEQHLCDVCDKFKSNQKTKLWAKSRPDCTADQLKVAVGVSSHSPMICSWSESALVVDSRVRTADLSSVTVNQTGLNPDTVTDNTDTT